MLRAFADAARVLSHEGYRQVARENAEFLVGQMLRGGRLSRIWKEGEASIPGFLEDYANVADGLLALYEASLEDRWLRTAWQLADQAIGLFWDGEQGLFYDSGTDHEALVFRPHDAFDNATPAGSSVMADILLRLHALTGAARYREIAERVLTSQAGLMARVPVGFGRLLCAADFALAEVQEVAIVGNPEDPATNALLAVARASYAPYRVVALGRPGSDPVVPLLAGRQARDGRPAVYVCRNFACQAPVSDPNDLLAVLTGR